MWQKGPIKKDKFFIQFVFSYQTLLVYDNLQAKVNLKFRTGKSTKLYFGGIWTNPAPQITRLINCRS
jgi:hypothetical protein